MRAVFSILIAASLAGPASALAWTSARTFKAQRWDETAPQYK